MNLPEIFLFTSDEGEGGIIQLKHFLNDKYILSICKPNFCLDLIFRMDIKITDVVKFRGIHIEEKDNCLPLGHPLEKIYVIEGEIKDGVFKGNYQWYNPPEKGIIFN